MGGLDDMVNTILKEMQMRQMFLSNLSVETIYFGGGTPSVLPSHQVEEIIEKIEACFDLSDDLEITFEANPDDLSATYLSELKSLGINRLSIGLQSLQDGQLSWMNRSHDLKQALDSITEAKKADFHNLNVDMIYGLPSLSVEQWIEEIKEILSMGIQHLSTYCLTVEPRTVLNHQVRTKKTLLPPDDVMRNQYINLLEVLDDHGWTHYEISNSCVPGFESKHNTSYWKGETYLGIGPSAHSFKGNQRSWNVSNNVKYVKSIEGGKLPMESEALTRVDRFNEYILTHLRTKEGCHIEHLQNLNGWKSIEPLVMALQKADLLRISDEFISLTIEGQLMADYVSRELFIESLPS